MGYNEFVMLCEKSGIKPIDVSRATGVSTATLTNWKHGKYMPKIDKIQKIAEYFGVDTEYLLSGRSSEKTSVEGTPYYFSDEAAQAAQEIFENKELRLLFSSARDASPEDIKTIHNLLLALKRKERE